MPLKIQLDAARASSEALEKERKIERNQVAR
jgi:hypothetical protein